MITRSPNLQAFLNSLAGKDVPATIAAGRCVRCAGPAREFTDAISAREHALTGYCQKCQDIVYAAFERMEECE